MVEKEDVLSDKKIEVITKDIPEDVQSEVADICMNADDLTNVKKYSKKIKDLLDRKFGSGWNVIMGESFSGSCSVAEKSFLQIKISNIMILVFKSSKLVKGSDSSK
ncbi:dynein light chain LC8-type [Nematocida homosporus]|uniref:dynein light chain LC8-type n=1 Tax=Nematocida homosporus TaxID=1912981 RepID=UPI00221E7D85|nr:dynein light chain LC8-type [Nematocida homosporus]KAI5186015.1 dynein light chain LC8-type [Nematocida homosporus]